MPSLDLTSLFAAAAFEKRMLQSNHVLGVDEHSEDGLAIVGVNLEVLFVGRGASNALLEGESQIELRVMYCKGFSDKGSEELCTP